jgi:hypothetical protein
MASASRVIVLAEDQCHQRFVHGYLRRLGYLPHDIRDAELPSGRGCGEQWVRERYEREVREYRRRSARAATALVAVIDADRGDVNRRLQQFHQALIQARLAQRTPDERIVHLVPKRSIETWILCLNGGAVDEETDYSQEDIAKQVAPAATALFEWSRPNNTPPSHCISSLLAAIPEVRRLE